MTARVLDMDVLQERRRTRGLFQEFMAGAQIGMASEQVILFRIRRRVTIAPEQYAIAKIAQFGARITSTERAQRSRLAN